MNLNVENKIEYMYLYTSISYDYRIIFVQMIVRVTMYKKLK